MIKHSETKGSKKNQGFVMMTNPWKFYCGGTGGGLPGGGGGGVKPGGGVEILLLGLLFAEGSFVILPDTGTRWPFAYMH